MSTSPAQDEEEPARRQRHPHLPAHRVPERGVPALGPGGEADVVRQLCDGRRQHPGREPREQRRDDPQDRQPEGHDPGAEHALDRAHAPGAYLDGALEGRRPEPQPEQIERQQEAAPEQHEAVGGGLGMQERPRDPGHAEHDERQPEDENRAGPGTLERERARVRDEPPQDEPKQYPGDRVRHGLHEIEPQRATRHPARPEPKRQEPPAPPGHGQPFGPSAGGRRAIARDDPAERQEPERRQSEERRAGHTTRRQDTVPADRERADDVERKRKRPRRGEPESGRDEQQRHDRGQRRRTAAGAAGRSESRAGYRHRRCRRSAPPARCARAARPPGPRYQRHAGRLVPPAQGAQRIAEERHQTAPAKPARRLT